MSETVEKAVHEAMHEVNAAKGGKMKKTARILAIFVIVGVIIAAMMASFNQKTPNFEKVWDPEMTIGNMEAKNYFVIYSDVVCPYCVAFENAIVENQEEFEKYLADNDVLVEIRLSDFLYEYGQSNPISSKYSAEAVYCAKKAGKFWDYYDHAIHTVWEDYFADGGKNALTELDKQGKEYWIRLGKDVGLSAEFEKCVKNDEEYNTITGVAAKMAKNISGLPYFKFNKYISSGFDMNWGFDYVKMYFDSGLKNI